MKLIENYVTGVPSSASDRTTQYGYDHDGHLRLLTLQNSETGAQVTRWEYGTTLEESGVASSQLLWAKVYPDSADAGNPLSAQCEGDCYRLPVAFERGYVGIEDASAQHRRTAPSSKGTPFSPFPRHRAE